LSAASIYIEPIYVGLTPKLYIGEKPIYFGGETMKIEIDDVDYITETALTIRGSRRRTTIPKTIVDKLKLVDGDCIRWILFKDSSIVITPVRKKE
jgi:hypothetical protein